MRINPNVEKTINKILGEIELNKLILPVIQRKYVWNKERIEKLFDSIYRGYPIGILLCWEIKKDFVNQYKDCFYKFIDHQDEDEPVNNEKFLIPATQEGYSVVLDGQQRITSIVIGLKGYIKKKNDRIEKMYFNVLSDPDAPINDNDESAFKFINDNNVKDDDKHIWFLLNDFYKGDTDSEFNDFCFNYLKKKGINNTSDSTYFNITTRLQMMRKRIFNDSLFRIFEVETGKFDEALEAFVRLNNQGKQLTKADLLFSNILSKIPMFRETVESFIDDINGFGEGFNFDLDFVLKCFAACLKKTIKYKFDLFNDNIDIINNNVDNVQEAIKNTLKFLLSIGITSHDKLASSNMIIPLIYYNYITKFDFDSNDVKKYVVLSIIKGVFSSSSDTVGSNLISIIDEDVSNGNADKVFKLDWLLGLRDRIGINYSVEQSDIEYVVDNYSKGNAIITGLLYLLYPDVNSSQYNYHEDHMHAKAILDSKKRIKKIFVGYTDDQIDKIYKNKEKLPNLQLLPSSENLKKSDKLLIDWINESDNNKKLIKYCDGVKSFELVDFMEFYEKRRKNIVEALCNMLSK